MEIFIQEEIIKWITGIEFFPFIFQKGHDPEKIFPLETDRKIARSARRHVEDQRGDVFMEGCIVKILDHAYDITFFVFVPGPYDFFPHGLVPAKIFNSRFVDDIGVIQIRRIVSGKISSLGDFDPESRDKIEVDKY